jgi:4-hydroxy-tetrahydrodipicolinate synthase
MVSKIEGVICPMVTPFGPNEEIDEPTMRSHIDFQISAGVHGLMFMGGAGEFISLNDRERIRMMEIAVEHVNRRVPVIIGLISPSTTHVTELARHANRIGANAIMALPPFYVSPSRTAIYAHYSHLANQGELPIVVYNNPCRTNVNLDTKMMSELAEIEAVVAMKDCDRDLASLSEKIEVVGHRIQMLSGEDDLAFPSLMLGAKGGMWATVNLFPETFVAMYEAALAGNVEDARRHHYDLLPLWKSCFVANHPAALKEAMAMASRPVGKARPPLQSLTEGQLASIRDALIEHKATGFAGETHR